MAKRRDERPLHERVAAELRARIMAGDLRTGDQLPSNTQLVEEFDASSPTIQRALKMLKDEGFVFSHQGKGVFVRDRQPFILPASAYFAPAAGSYSYDLLEVAETRPPAEVVKAFGLQVGARAVLRKRVLRHDGSPVELNWSFYPTELAIGTALAAPTKIRGGAPRVLAELGYAQIEMVDTVSVRMPTTEEVEMLDLPDVPVMRQFRVIYAEGQRPVEASILIKGAHLYQVQYRQPTA